MSSRHLVVVTGLALALLTASTASAQADVRFGSVRDPIDTQPKNPSLNARPLVTEVTGASVSYDQQAGVVAAAVSFNRSAYEEPFTAVVTLRGPRACAYAAQDPVPELEFRLDTVPPTGSTGGPQPRAEAKLERFAGAVAGAAVLSGDGRTFSASVRHSAFASRDWRCVFGSSEAASPDDFEFSFAGFEPKRLTRTSALPALKTELTRRYGSRWRTRGSWAVCPRQEFFPDGLSEDSDGTAALCEFRFREGRHWRHGSVTLSEKAGGIVASYFRSTRFIKRMRPCRPLRPLRREGLSSRRLRSGGWVGCRDSSASLIRDLHHLKPGVRRVGFHGTNRAGFEDAVLFRCRLRARGGGRRSATCVNKLGDRFVYKFRLR